jgi:fatty-acyl-CoA synthase
MTWSGLDPAGPTVTDAERTLDRRAFRDLVLRVAAGLRKGGVRPGARVALWLPNGTAYLAAIFACARLGALAIHINTRFRLAEIGSLLRRSRATAGRLPRDLHKRARGGPRRVTPCVRD